LCIPGFVPSLVSSLHWNVTTTEGCIKFYRCMALTFHAVECAATIDDKPWIKMKFDLSRGAIINICPA